MTKFMCSFCTRKAVYHRKYEGVYLCERHFVRSIEEKVKRTIRRHRMVQRNDCIAFALSGGKDSSAVLYIMKKIFKNRKDLKFFAISVDEGIPGYRDESLKIAKRLCETLGVEHHIFSFKKEFGKTLEEKVRDVKKSDIWEGTACTYCGLARRWLLNKKARELGAKKIAFGMNLDDEVQGIMMDYVRGDLVRLARMGGEPIVSHKLFVPRIKPFREIPEKEIGLYAILSGLEIQERECPYLEGPRFRVRDFLNDLESESPGIKFSVLRTFEKLLPHVREIVKKEGVKIRKCEKCGEPSSQKICKTCELWRKQK
ncbi:MAG: TIGR00269 family protein [Candidatus Aenigmarchaeota archaeon]|nr:TIGR00269 family protein [Candidatus Aenigmarchaeota archaeon]